MNISAIICISLLIIIGISFCDGYQKGLLSLIRPLASFIIAYMIAYTGDIELMPDFGLNGKVSEMIQEINLKAPENLELKGLENLMKNSLITATKADNNKLIFSSKNIIIFIITYSIIYSIISFFIKPVRNAALIGTSNRIAGALASTGICIIKVWIIMDIIYILAMFIPQVHEIQVMLNTSSFYKYLYKMNPTIY